MASTKNAICIWDFTQHDLEEWGIDETKNWCREHCKKWCFQLERGEKTGKLHLQGKISLGTKKRSMVGEMGKAHWSPSHTESFSYVCKEETREDGPWDDRNTVEYIPTHIRNKHPYAWQKKILDSAGLVEREINVIVDEDGCQGKTILACMARAKGYITIPPIGDAERLIATTCDILKAKKLREPGLIIFDIPRSVDKRRLNSLFITIETIKAGWVYDTRNAYKEWIFDPPAVWVMSNHEIPDSYMSKDTWKVWSIENGRSLAPRSVAACDRNACASRGRLRRFQSDEIDSQFDWEVQEQYSNYLIPTDNGASL